MARVPTEAEIEAMSEDELEAFLSGDQDPGGGPRGDDAPRPDVAPGGWQATSGAPRTYAWLLVAASVIGVAACWELMVSELRQLREPLAELSCDINPLVSCGASLDVWQGNLLGVPNSFVGAMAFAVLLVVGLLLASGHRLPRWVWWGLTAGTVAGVLFVAWFLGVSVLTLGRLCPFCMLIWAVTLPVAAHTWGQAALGGHLGLGEGAARRLWALRWWLTAAAYLAVVLTVVVGLWDSWMLVL